MPIALPILRHFTSYNAAAGQDTHTFRNIEAVKELISAE